MKILLVSVSFLILLFSSGCATAVGFAVGQKLDHENQTMDSITLDQIHTLKGGDRILIEVNEERQRGVFETIEGEMLVMRVLTTQSGGVWDRIPLSDISRVYRFHHPHDATMTGVSMGLMVDIVLLGIAFLVTHALESFVP